MTSTDGKDLHWLISGKNAVTIFLQKIKLLTVETAGVTTVD
jgi:hypothetical protein